MSSYFVPSFVAIFFFKLSFGTTDEEIEIISHVPEDCSDLKKVKIDNIFTKNQTYFAVYGNFSRYVKVTDITADHLPIVRLKDQPEVFDDKIKQFLEDAKIFDNYLFDDNTYSLKNKSGIYLIGFNYLWLGCPQALCLSGTVDAATSLANGTVYVFRGNYFWDLKDPPFVKNAKKIMEWKGSNKDETDFDFGYFNSVVTNANFTSFYTKDRQYIWDERLVDSIELSVKEFQFNLDAAFYVRYGNKGITFYIKDDEIMNDTNPFLASPSSKNGILWNKVDAGFAKGSVIYILKDWHYIELANNSPFPPKPKPVYKDLYNCPSTLYEVNNENVDKNIIIVLVILSIIIISSIVILIVLRIRVKQRLRLYISE